VPLKVRLLFQDGEQLHVEVDYHLELVKALHDVQDGLLLFQGNIDIADPLKPVIAVVRNELIKLLLEQACLVSEVCPHILVEVLTKDLLDTFLIDHDLLLDLRGPCDVVRHSWEISQAREDVALLILALAEELLFERLDVLADLLKDLVLVLFDGNSDPRPLEEWLEEGEDLEHLVGISCGGKLVLKGQCDLRLYLVDLVVIVSFGRIENVLALLRNVQHVDSEEVVVSLVDVA
jgi:hypothetical protein